MKHLDTDGQAATETDADNVGKLTRRPLHVIADWLHSLAGWIVTGLLIYGPFAFGSVSPFAIRQIEVALTLATVLWGVGCLLAWRWPRVSVIVLVCGIAALVLGWFMTWNARSVYPLFFVRNFAQRRPLLPGAEEMFTAKLAMLRADALFGGLIVAIDLASAARWRERWANTIACTGAAIACFGVMQQAGLVTFVVSRMNQMEGEYFSTYNYHGNAGAYMNLALPLSIAGLLYSQISGKSAYQRVCCLTLVLLTMVGILANPSRGAQVLSVAILLGMGIVAAARFTSHKSPLYRNRRIVWPLIGVGVVVILSIVALQSTRNAQKWRELPSELAKNSSRWQVWRVTVPMAKTAGALGHGPGTFKLLLPTSPLLSDALFSRWIIQRHIPGTRISMWSMAHNDYLQTWVEYGWVGALLYGTILFGGAAVAIRKTASSLLKTTSHVRDGFVMFGVVAAMLGVMVHATFDFPMQVASIQVTVVVLLGICWSASGKIWPQKTQNSHKLARAEG